MVEVEGLVPSIAELVVPELLHRDSEGLEWLPPQVTRIDIGQIEEGRSHRGDVHVQVEEPRSAPVVEVLAVLILIAIRIHPPIADVEITGDEKRNSIDPH